MQNTLGQNLSQKWVKIRVKSQIFYEKVCLAEVTSHNRKCTENVLIYAYGMLNHPTKFHKYICSRFGVIIFLHDLMLKCPMCMAINTAI